MKRNIEIHFGLYGFDYIKNYFDLDFSVLKLGLVVIVWEIK